MRKFTVGLGCAAMASCLLSGLVHAEALPSNSKYASLVPQSGAATRIAPANFVLFFNVQSSKLSADAKSIVRAAVDAAQRAHAKQIELTALSAKDETAHDPLLASRRAASVKAEIAQLGFTSAVVTGGGQAPGLLSVSNGSDDTVNRRVVISMRPG